MRLSRIHVVEAPSKKPYFEYMELLPAEGVGECFPLWADQLEPSFLECESGAVVAVRLCTPSGRIHFRGGVHRPRGYIKGFAIELRDGSSSVSVQIYFHKMVRTPPLSNMRAECGAFTFISFIVTRLICNDAVPSFGKNSQ
jgi:hypothetical protein